MFSTKQPYIQNATRVCYMVQQFARQRALTFFNRLPIHTALSNTYIRIITPLYYYHYYCIGRAIMVLASMHCISHTRLNRDPSNIVRARARTSGFSFISVSLFTYSSTNCQYVPHCFFYLLFFFIIFQFSFFPSLHFLFFHKLESCTQ